MSDDSSEGLFDKFADSAISLARTTDEFNNQPAIQRTKLVTSQFEGTPIEDVGNFYIKGLEAKVDIKYRAIEKDKEFFHAVNRKINDWMNYLNNRSEAQKLQDAEHRIVALNPLIRKESHGDCLVLPLNWSDVTHLLVKDGKTYWDKVQIRIDGGLQAGGALAGGIFVAGGCALLTPVTRGQIQLACAPVYVSTGSTIVSGTWQAWTGEEKEDYVNNAIVEGFSYGIMSTGDYDEVNAQKLAKGATWVFSKGVTKKLEKLADKNPLPPNIGPKTRKIVENPKAAKVVKAMNAASWLAQKGIEKNVIYQDGFVQEIVLTDPASRSETASDDFDSAHPHSVEEVDYKGEFDLTPGGDLEYMVFEEANNHSKIMEEYESVVLGVSKEILIWAITEAFWVNKDQIKQFIGKTPFEMPGWHKQISFEHEFDQVILYKIYKNHTLNLCKKVKFTIVREWEYSWTFKDPDHPDPSEVAKQPFITPDAPEYNKFLGDDDFFLIMEPIG